jgi:hypothetical protein
MKQSLYEVLGVRRDATQADIEEAFARLCDEYQARRERGDGEAANQLLFLNEAYATLSDAQKRDFYDSTIAAANNRPKGNADPSDGNRFTSARIEEVTENEVASSKSVRLRTRRWMLPTIALGGVALLMFMMTPLYLQKTSTDKARPSIEALKKLQLRTQVGINYMDYSRILAETLYPVTQYLKTSDGNKDTDSNRIIQSVAADYLLASRVWDAKIKKTYLKDDPTHEHGGLATQIAMKYNGYYTNDQDWLDPDKAIAMIWGHATKELDKLPTKR